MALFKISKGVKANLPSIHTEGYCYFTTDDGKFYIDTTNTAAGRILLNAGKADQLSTARTISLTGDVTGSATFDGSNNISITATVANNSHNHSASNITSGTLAIARGGTGATTAADACKNIGAMYLDPNDTAVNGEAALVNAGTFNGMTYAQVKADIAATLNASVKSVNGKTGVVTLAASDVGAASTTGANASGNWPINITGTASFVDMISGTSSSSAVPLNDIGAGKIKYYYNVSNSLDGNMPAQNNANGILYLNTHSGEYGYQLGFSSNGNIYYRRKDGSAFINSTPWKALLSSDNFTSYVTPAAIGAAKASHTHTALSSGSAKIEGVFESNIVTGVRFVNNSGNSLGVIRLVGSNSGTDTGFNDLQLTNPAYNDIRTVYHTGNLSFSLSGATLSITKS